MARGSWIPKVDRPLTAREQRTIDLHENYNKAQVVEIAKQTPTGNFAPFDTVWGTMHGANKSELVYHIARQEHPEDPEPWAEVPVRVEFVPLPKRRSR